MNKANCRLCRKFATTWSSDEDHLRHLEIFARDKKEAEERLRAKRAKMTTKVEPTVNRKEELRRIVAEAWVNGQDSARGRADIESIELWVTQIEELFEPTLNPTKSCSLEPTVEGWEREFDNKFGKIEVFFDEKNKEYYAMILPEDRVKDDEYGLQDIKSFIRTLLTRSLQEARVEERQEIITKLHNVRSKHTGYISLMELSDVISTLTTKEEE